jgi:hypothetical protein
MHMSLNSFAGRLAAIDNLPASNDAVVLCKKELRLSRIVLNSSNWPGTDMVLLNGIRRMKTYPRSLKLTSEEKRVFFDVHIKTLKDKLRSFETILAIIDRRPCAAL